MIPLKVADFFLHDRFIALKGVNTLNDLIVLFHLQLQLLKTVGNQFIGGEDATKRTNQRSCLRQERNNNHFAHW